MRCKWNRDLIQVRKCDIITIGQEKLLEIERMNIKVFNPSYRETFNPVKRVFEK